MQNDVLYNRIMKEVAEKGAAAAPWEKAGAWHKIRLKNGVIDLADSDPIASDCTFYENGYFGVGSNKSVVDFKIQVLSSSSVTSSFGIYYGFTVDEDMTYIYLGPTSEDFQPIDCYLYLFITDFVS